ncbi:MAG: tRNA-guanine transglycosylase, partial [Actinobacteria bacterium]|nr:tRNA-guanine transglycosylase [Actinomycetota bacterium]NIS35259.1 tRNA-guanine transglycosylase [Actinomycetota bacterium]NIT98023.1 tRNA-guanine transglycosylase [Actinomycetota bacterium]NIU21657.1 tRNA-guanine transglycosylase [Actinomycetota bacterium]NIU69972.1 tRNA-guanine transglycosylase [Actinomycetota bacterium]
VLDVCPSSVADPAVLRSAVDRTALWAGRGRKAFLAHPDAIRRQCQFGIVQGGTDEALRVESAQRTVALDFDGYAVGGLSVGEERSEMLHGLDA